MLDGEWIIFFQEIILITKFNHYKSSKELVLCNILILLLIQ